MRQAAGIVRPVHPAGFSPDTVYDKWGNILREDGMRTAGPLATDDGMRKALQYGRMLQLLLAHP